MTPEHSITRTLALLGLLSAPSAALAQSYTFTQGSGSFVSISGSGVPVTMSGTDDGTGSVSLPFSFSFFGNPVSTVYPSTNGLLAFDAPESSYSNTALPSSSTGAIVAVYWDDMSIPSGSAVYSQVTGTSGRRIATIEWSRLTPLNGADSIDVQVRLYEQTGNIEVLYGPGIGFGTSGTVGLQDAFGSTAAGPSCGLSGSCGFGDLPSGTLLTFTPSGVAPQLPDLVAVRATGLPTTAVPGNVYSVDVVVRNNGGMGAGAFGVQLATEVLGTTEIVGEGTAFSLGAGQEQAVTIEIEVPLGAPSGVYTIMATVDPFGDVSEANESNNAASVGFVTVGGGGGQSISITSNTVPPATLGVSYSFQLQQTGATAPTWSVSGGSLPPGITLSSSGRLSGTPASDGDYSFGVQCTQSGFTPGVMSYVLSVSSGTGFRLASSMLPQATVGQAFSGRIEALGGQAPYAYQIVSGKPGWLSMAADGSLSGTPDAPGNHELRVSVFDSATMFVEGVVTLEVVQGGPLVLLTQASDVVAGVVGLPYTVQLRAQGGMQPYTFSVSSGTLPAGLALDVDRITGSPTTGGRSSFELRVTDGAGGTASGSFSIEVTELAPLVIGVPDTVTIRPETDADVPLVASGGVPPYQWAIVAGALPSGLRLEGDRLRGTSTSSRATARVTIQVSDTQAGSAMKEVTIEVRKATNNSSGGGGGTTRRSEGCVCVRGADEPSAALGVLMLGLVGMLWRRRSFLRAASVVEDEACPSRSSHDAPRS